MSEVFISYAWGGESEEIANSLEQTFQKTGIKLVRDKIDLGYKGLIKKFMQDIGQGKCIVAIISDKYLKSKNCMFELLEISRNGDFYDRIFPIVLKDAGIYDFSERIKYIKYWEDKAKELEDQMKTISLANLQGLREEIDLYTEIRGKIAKLVDMLQNMNTLTVEIHKQTDFSAVVGAIKEQLKIDEQKTTLSAEKTINPPTKTKIEPLKLRITLRNLIESDLNDLIVILKVPRAIIPPDHAPQANRVEALWAWAQSPTGCGLDRLQQVLHELLEKNKNLF